MVVVLAKDDNMILLLQQSSYLVVFVLYFIIFGFRVNLKDFNDHNVFFKIMFAKVLF